MGRLLNLQAWVEINYNIVSLNSPLFYRDEGDDYDCLIVIQCDSGHINGDLISCARYRIYDERVKALERNKCIQRRGVTHVLFIINLPHQVLSSRFVGFQGDPWISAHIDDLRPTSRDTIIPLEALSARISELFIGGYINVIGSMDMHPQPGLEANSPPHEHIAHPFAKSINPLINEENEEEARVDGQSENGFEAGDDIEGYIEPNMYEENPQNPDISESPQHLKVVDLVSESPESTTTFSQEQIAHAAAPNSTDIEDITSEELETADKLQNNPSAQDVDFSDTTSQEDLSEIFMELFSEHKVGDDTEHYTDSNVKTQASLLQFAETSTSNEVSIACTNGVVLASPQPKKQLVASQCRRLHACIQAAASKLEESSTKHRSIQIVICLTKLIPRIPTEQLSES